MAFLLVKGVTGLEKAITIEMTERFGLKVVATLPGKVLVEADAQDVALLNLYAATPTRVYYLLDSFAVESEEDLKEIASNLKILKENFPEVKTFGVKSKRISVSWITSPEISKVIGERIVSTLGWKVDLTSPDIWIYAEVNRGMLYLGIDTTGISLHRRGYRVFDHPAPIQSVIPPSLFFLFGKKPEERIFDPFCGGGTFVIEDLLLSANKPKVWRHFEFEKFRFFKSDKRLGERKVKGKSLGMDLSVEFVRGATENAKNAGVGKNAIFYVGDAREPKNYERVASMNIEWIFTNPPYGGRLKYRSGLDRIYRFFIKNAVDFGFKTVFISGYSKIRKILEELGPENVTTKQIKYGGKTAWIVSIFP